jgi:hypothetical protein
MKSHQYSLVSDMEEFDLDIPEPLLKKNVVANITSVLVCIVVLLLIVVVVLSVTLITLSYGYKHIPEKECPIVPVVPEFVAPEPQNSNILNTKEYTLDLPTPELWNPRLTFVQEWVTNINSVSDYLTLDMDDMYSLSYAQFLLNPTCNVTNKDRFRVRLFDDGSLFHQTIDLKNKNVDHKSLSSAASLPYWPGTAFYPDSYQKLEHEIDSCSDTYSRETMVHFSEPHAFTHCGDLLAVFPWSFSIENDELMNPVTADPAKYWWLGMFEGYMDQVTKYELQFTLCYTTSDGMLYESTSPIKGEWSLRIYSLEDGHDDTWDTAADTDANNVWLYLGDNFSTTNCTTT